MKRIFIALGLVLALTACGAEEPQGTPEPETQPVQTTQDASEEKGDVSALSVPFEGIHDGAEIAVKERPAFVEVQISAPDLDVNTEPSGWGETCDALLAAMGESQGIADSQFDGKAVSVRLIDGSGENLFTAANGRVQYDAFKEPDEEEDSGSSGDNVITLHEYNRISVGMRYEECVEIIGGPGTQTGQYGDAAEYGIVFDCEWQGNGDGYSKAVMTFDDYVLRSKFEVGLE